MLFIVLYINATQKKEKQASSVPFFHFFPELLKSFLPLLVLLLVLFPLLFDVVERTLTSSFSTAFLSKSAAAVVDEKVRIKAQHVSPASVSYLVAAAKIHAA